MSARGSGEKPSIVVLHSINFEESWTKQTYLDIENKFGKEGFTVKAIPLQIPGIRTMEGFQEKRTMILERVPAAGLEWRRVFHDPESFGNRRHSHCGHDPYLCSGV